MSTMFKCICLVLFAVVVAAEGFKEGRSDVFLRGNDEKNGVNRWLEEKNKKLPMDPSGVMPSVAAQEARAVGENETAEVSELSQNDDGALDAGASGLEGAENEVEGGDDHHGVATTEELEARLKDVDSMKQFIHRHMSKMHDLIKAESERMEMERKRNAELQRKQKRNELEKAMRARVNITQIEARFRKRRKEINKCLLMIHGGADRLYWDLRKKFMTIPSGQVCIVFKKIAFPHLPVVGFTEALYKKYINWSPPSDGSMLQYFDAVKTKIFRCMCEESDMKMSLKDMQAASRARTPAVDNIDQLSKKYIKEYSERLKKIQKTF